MLSNLAGSRPAQKIVELKFAQVELKSMEDFRGFLEHEQELETLGQLLGHHDRQLLERLCHAGLNAKNIYALTWLPVAMVAWASHGVSEDEVRVARLVNLYSHCDGNPESAALFQSWLVDKPVESLCNLWEEVARLQAAKLDEAERRQTGEAVLDLSTKVAKASGGILGFGQVSPAEQQVLDRIRAVYNLAPFASHSSPTT